MEVCPFDDLHLVKTTRFQKHIMNCEKRYTNIGYTKCMFNATHIIKVEEKLEHLKICEDASDERVFKIKELINAGRKKFNDVCNDAVALPSDKDLVLNWIAEEDLYDKVDGWLKDTSDATTLNIKKSNRKQDKPSSVASVKSSSPNCPLPLRKAVHFVEKEINDEAHHLDVDLHPDDSASSVGIFEPVHKISTNPQVDDADDSGSVSGASEAYESTVSNPKRDNIKIVKIKDLLKSVSGTQKKWPAEENIIFSKPSASNTNDCMPLPGCGSSPEDSPLVPFDMQSVISDCDSFVTAVSSVTTKDECAAQPGDYSPSRKCDTSKGPRLVPLNIKRIICDNKTATALSSNPTESQITVQPGDSLFSKPSASNTNDCMPLPGCGSSPEDSPLVPFDMQSVISDCDSFVTAVSSVTTKDECAAQPGDDSPSRNCDTSPKGPRLVPLNIKSKLSDSSSFVTAVSSITTKDECAAQPRDYSLSRNFDTSPKGPRLVPLNIKSIIERHNTIAAAVSSSTTNSHAVKPANTLPLPSPHCDTSKGRRLVPLNIKRIISDYKTDTAISPNPTESRITAQQGDSCPNRLSMISVGVQTEGLCKCPAVVF